jgi:hypothetical protein
VADERLAALRVAPNLNARLIQRLSRGRFVSVRTTRRNYEGVFFSHVVVTRRTSGWVQSEALVMSGRSGDDERLAHLIGGTDEFERVARARIFIDTFPRSPLRPKILLRLGDAAEEAAAQLTREATRRFERREIPTGRRARLFLLPELQRPRSLQSARGYLHFRPREETVSLRWRCVARDHEEVSEESRGNGSRKAIGKLEAIEIEPATYGPIAANQQMRESLSEALMS